MQINFYGLVLDVSSVTVTLRSPWEATSLECRLFDAVAAVLKSEPEKSAKRFEGRITDASTWEKAARALDGVFMGWQEDADAAEGERRGWRWVLDAGTDVDDYGRPEQIEGVTATASAELIDSEPGKPEMVNDVDLDHFELFFQLRPRRVS